MSNIHIFISDIGAIFLIIVNIGVMIKNSKSLEHRLTKIETEVSHIMKKVDSQ
jgi:hypothetical protein